MPVVQDDLWKNPGNPGMIVVSSHGTVLNDGRLFMGYGAAQEALRRIPDIEYQCAQEVLAQAVDGLYGFLPVRPVRPEARIIGFGLFQTRPHWEAPPDPEIIRYSMEALRRYAMDHAEVKIRMNYPGIGEGGLAPEEVAPLLVPLPSTVTVCHHGEVTASVPGSFVGFKALYLQVENMLQDGRNNQAVEYLIANGYDLQSAMDQVSAVQRLLRERKDRGYARLQRWRGAQISR